MVFGLLTYGQIVFYTGIIIVSVSFIALITGTIGFFIKKQNLKKQLTDKYGF